ncbi:MAG: PspA/IM30 family protein [Planctomycetota bacterium]
MALEERTRHLLETAAADPDTPEGLERYVAELVHQVRRLVQHRGLLEVELDGCRHRIELLRQDILTWTEQAALSVSESRDDLARLALKKKAECTTRRDRLDDRLVQLQLDMESLDADLEQLRATVRRTLDRLAGSTTPGQA